MDSYFDGNLENEALCFGELLDDLSGSALLTAPASPMLKGFDFEAGVEASFYRFSLDSTPPPSVPTSPTPANYGVDYLYQDDDVGAYFPENMFYAMPVCEPTPAPTRSCSPALSLHGAEEIDILGMSRAKGNAKGSLQARKLHQSPQTVQALNMASILGEESEDEIDVVGVRQKGQSATAKRKVQALSEIDGKVEKNTKSRRLSSGTRSTSEGSKSPSGSEPRRRRTIEDKDKRNMHNVLERKRREDLKGSFAALRAQVPGLDDGERTPKVIVLKKAIDHIETLNARREFARAEKTRLLAQQAELRAHLRLITA